MDEYEPVRALGLMSGTSMDGVDGALVLTDGQTISGFGPSRFLPYSAAQTNRIAAAQGLWPGEDPDRLKFAAEVVLSAHSKVINGFKGIDIIGFHGQTLAHDPMHARTHQLGDGAVLAAQVKTPVVWDFRSQDMRQGGQGAPLAPFFHFACAKWINASEPMVFLNLGGVGNVTWVDPCREHPEQVGALLAFDTGPANAPINDLLSARLGQSHDRDGRLAARGRVDECLIDRVLEREFFATPPPKSLDRNAFQDVLSLVSDLCDADAAATLTALSAACIARAQRFFPAPPARWLLCGGGRQNPVLVAALQQRLTGEVLPVEHLGLDGDMLEAQAFAYLAVRVLRGLPTSAPGTTGCNNPVCGGQIARP